MFDTHVTARHERATAFPNTDWELVRAAGEDGERGNRAMARLCELYWYPVYAFVRRREWRKSADDAMDLAQEFFARRLGSRDVGAADPERGRFRSWLLGALKNFLASQHQYDARKRRKAEGLVWLDAAAAEERLALEPRSELDPERLFDRDCALDVLRRGLERLGSEYAARGEAAWFQEAKQLLIPGETELRYEALEKTWGLGEDTLKSRVKRLRSRFGKLVDDELEQRVGAANVQAEREFLINAIWLTNP